MKNTRITKLLVSFMAVVLLLASCGGGKKTTADNTLRLASLFAPNSLNSITDSEAVNFQIISNFSEGLLTYTAEHELTGSMAETWDVSPDKLTYTFHLRDGLVWSNDEPITANDFVFGWQQLATNPNAVYGNLLDCVKNGEKVRKGELDVTELGIEAKDDKTFVATLEQPTIYFDKLVAFAPFFPVNEKFYNEVGADTYGTSKDTVLANGPYVLESYDPSLEYTLVKNEKYWDAANVAVDRVETRIIPEPTTQSALYDTGELDRLQLNSDLVEQYAGNPDIVTQEESAVYYFYISGVTGKPDPVLANKNFRAAVAHAIDKDLIANQILKNGSIGIDYLVPKNFDYLDGKDFREFSGKFNKPMFDTIKAQEFLEAAKAELGDTELKFELALADTDAAKKIYENIKSQIETNLPGVKVDLKMITQTNYYPTVQEMQTPAGSAGWGADFVDVATYFSIFQSGDDHNYGMYNSPTYDGLLEEAGKETSPTVRWEKFVAAEETLLNDYAIVPIYQRGATTLLNPRVKGYSLNSTSPDVYFKFIALED